MTDGQREIGDRSQNHSGVRVSTLEETAQSSQDRWMHSKNKSEWREKSLEKDMNGPRRLKGSLTHGIKTVKTVPTERETYHLGGNNYRHAWCRFLFFELI